MRNLVLIALVMVLSGCALMGGAREVPVPEEPILMDAMPNAEPMPVTGSIFQSGREMRLFEDRTARRIGDIITVKLVESTNAQKAASTSLSRESGVEFSDPTLLGKTAVGAPALGLLQNELEGKTSFDGKGNVGQSNKLSGDVTVMVVGVQPNGNLLLKGAKRIALNDGEEEVTLTGIVRPDDVNPDNTVFSNRIANARISYTGKGSMRDANTQGWLSKFFMSVFSPL
jgi:flagellar L-ring protein FlgH